MAICIAWIPMAVMLHMVPFIILCIVAIFGTFGNVFIIGAVCLQKTLRVRGSVFVIYLAIADLIITSYIMPMGLATSRYQVNPFGDVLCKVNAFLILLTSGVSTQSLMMIALERYFHICKIHWYRRIFTKRVIGILVAFSWLYSAAWTCHGWTGWTSFIYGEDVYVCILDGTVSISYDICLTVFGMVLPMMVLSFCYLKIFCTVRSSRRHIRSEKQLAKEHPDDPTLLTVYKQKKKKLQKEQRLVCTLFTIVILFIVFWLPASVVLPLAGFWADMPKILYTISVWTAFSNSSVNSVVYGAMNKNFRRGYVSLLKRMFCGCRRRECHATASRSHDSTSASTSQSKLPSPDTSIINQDPNASNQATIPRRTTTDAAQKYHSKHRKEQAEPSTISIEMLPSHTTTRNDVSEPNMRDTSDIRTIIHTDGDTRQPVVYNEVVFVSKI